MNTAFIAIILVTCFGEISNLQSPKSKEANQKEVKEVTKAVVANVTNGTTIQTETTTVAAHKEKEQLEKLSRKKLENKGGKITKNNSTDQKGPTKSSVNKKTESTATSTKMPPIKQANDTNSNAKETNVQEINSERVLDKNDEFHSEEEIYDLHEEMNEDDLGAEAVKGNRLNLVEDMEEDLYLPVSGRLDSLLQSERVMDEPFLLSERVMDEPDFLPRADAVMEEPNYNSEPQTSNSELSAERVVEQPAGTQPGGDGKVKMNLNLKDLDGDPSDLTVGVAAVGLMEQAVRSKGPDNSQVNAIAGFGHQIMGLVSELEKDLE